VGPDAASLAPPPRTWAIQPSEEKAGHKPPTLLRRGAGHKPPTPQELIDERRAGGGRVRPFILPPPSVRPPASVRSSSRLRGHREGIEPPSQEYEPCMFTITLPVQCPDSAKLPTRDRSRVWPKGLRAAEGRDLWSESRLGCGLTRGGAYWDGRNRTYLAFKRQFYRLLIPHRSSSRPRS
jgi:hypothetical protein